MFDATVLDQRIRELPGNVRRNGDRRAICQPRGIQTEDGSIRRYERTA